MAQEDKIRVAEEYVEALNAHDYARMRSYHGRNFRFQALGVIGPGDEVAYRAYMEQNWIALPDLIFKIASMAVQGDHVIQNWIATATHDGPLTIATGEERLATGRKGTTAGSSTMKFKNGKIMLVDIYFDVPALVASMDVLPGA